jgi:hypothetical protein
MEVFNNGNDDRVYREQNNKIGSAKIFWKGILRKNELIQNV